MINKLNLKPIINKERLFRKLHIAEGSETFRNADGVFSDLIRIIMGSMDLTAVYKVTDSLNLNFEEPDEYEKYIICFVSSDDDISRMSHEMMSAGDYMKGYLLYETATDAVFGASCELNEIVREEAAKNGYKLSKRYAPGDAAIDLGLQKTLLDMLKKETEINAYLNEAQVLIPERSLLYVFGLKKGSPGGEGRGNCGCCENLNCQYREIVKIC